ncbi:DUF2244 domain-containing protein [Piscinibacter sakaiensis]|uniref:DUF2244 domain-containing protein n=1 Tax=Piscinibacter sakaiensis TaxID=1547922 RepID=UPI001E573012|nr:DUF2244 domain-containing protein [Piscinibacter sakaiensis]
MAASAAREPGGWRFGEERGDGAGGWQIEWTLRRNCSLAPAQMLGSFAVLSALSLAVATFFWQQGARLVMPFAWLEILALGAALLAYARHAADREHIALRRDTLTVERAVGRRVDRVEFQRAWVRVEPESGGDRSLIELSGQGRRIAVGRFVRPELRALLAAELRVALRREPPPAAA